MNALRIGLAVLALAFVASIVWASLEKPIGESFSAIVADPWGLVTLLDLYLGFILFGLVIWFAEGQRPFALLWIVPIFFLGNIVPALWLILKLPRLAAMLVPREQ